MKIKNIKVDFDYNDADDVERFETEMNKASERLQNMTEENKTRSEIIREACGYVFDFIDNVFGENTHKKIFGEKCNLTMCLEVYKEIIEEIKKQANLPLNMTKKLVKQYTPRKA